MKHIKTFENITEDSKYNIGDYVLIDFRNMITESPAFVNFVENNIGKVIDIDGVLIKVQYDNIPDVSHFKNDSDRNPFNNNYVKLHESWIKYASNNKEDIEAYLNANKYNL